MEKNKSIEGNSLVAEFMGAKFKQEKALWYSGDTAKDIFPNMQHYNRPEQLKYHSSWDWLMPVVEKIESIEDAHHGHFGVHIFSNGCTIQATNLRTNKPMANPPHYFSDWTLETKIQSTWRAVVTFIQWFNSLPTNKQD